jgi:hypothetical protein
MTRVVSVGRSHGLVVAGALGLALLTVTLTGCPGSLQDPQDFPPPPGTTGAAGTNGGTAGTAAAGTMGTAGTGTAGTAAPAGCDIAPIIKTYSCALALACHDAKGSAAGLDMASATFASHLVGTLPGVAAGHTIQTPSICALDTTNKTVAYITKPTTPGGHAGGLILEKVKGPFCMGGGMTGVQMPTTGPPYLSTTEIACVQNWADALAAAAGP